MLLTDGPVNTSEELQHYENALLDVASTEGINVTQKTVLAQREIETDVLIFLMGSGIQDPKFLVRRYVECRDVVVTSPLKRWHAYRSLARVYQDAFNNQLNDRYYGKWQEYEKLSRQTSAQLFETGVGLVAFPVPKADVPLVTAGSTGACYVRVTWLNAHGMEGMPSDPVQADDSNGIGPVQIGTVPEDVTGWNIYVGNDFTTMWLQNREPLAPGASWTGSTVELQENTLIGCGQAPEKFVCNTRRIQRG